MWQNYKLLFRYASLHRLLKQTTCLHWALSWEVLPPYPANCAWILNLLPVHILSPNLISIVFFFALVHCDRAVSTLTLVWSSLGISLHPSQCCYFFLSWSSTGSWLVFSVRLYFGSYGYNRSYASVDTITCRVPIIFCITVQDSSHDIQDSYVEYDCIRSGVNYRQL